MATTKPSIPRAPIGPESWLTEHGDALYRYAFYRVFDRAAAEDLVQETLLAAWRARNQFRGESQIQTWLIGILKRKLIDFLRSRRELVLSDVVEDDDAVDRLFRDDPGQHWAVFPKEWANPDSALEQQQFWQAFYDCLSNLPPRQARLFSLAELEGLSGAELCKVVGASPSNVWVMMHRARLKLRECLEGAWFNHGNSET